MINVLVVEDSPTQAEFLSYLLNSDPNIRVVGVARDGEQAIEAAFGKRPDVITMDINMPRMNGFDATRQIMETAPTPIVIVTASHDPKDMQNTFLALEAGAVVVVAKPLGSDGFTFDETARELIRTVKLMSEVKVIKRWPRRKESVAAMPKLELKTRTEEIKIIAIGGSTGAPVILQTILSSLPKDFPVPLVIVQHMSAGFTQAFVQWLTASTGFPVHMAVHGQKIKSGNAYVAPDGFQMGLEARGCIALSSDEPEQSIRPSVSFLFRSVLKTFGANSLGILLSGMGKDGAKELKVMKEEGALTLVQDKESSVVYGMPGEAVKLNAASYVLSPANIASVIINLVRDDWLRGVR